MAVVLASATARAQPEDTGTPTSESIDESPAEARPTPDARPPWTAPYWLSIRPLQGGGGAGNRGIGVDYYASLDFWPTRFVGLGITGGLASEVTGFSDSLNTWFVGPSLIVRTHDHGSYVAVSAGVALAGVTTNHSDWLCGDACTTTSTYSSDIDFNATLAWLYHPLNGPIEVGPAIRADFEGPWSSAPANLLLTANLEFGFALR